MGRALISLDKKMDEDIYSSNEVQVFSDERIIFLACGIDEQSANTAISSIFHMLKKDCRRPINLVINTFGGSILDMFALYDTMIYAQEIGCPIHTIGLGKIMSAGVLLLAAGSKGNRKIGKRSSVMIHYAYEENVGGDVFALKNNLDELERCQKLIDEMLIKHTKLKQTDINEMLKDRKDFYLSAEKAIELGIVDSFLGEK